MRFIRRWWWAILLVLVVIVRAALPAIVRSQVETRASEALRASVKVGNVDLALLAGGVALDDVAVRPTDAPADAEPLIAWKRLAVDLRWLSLLRKVIRFSTIELTEPHVALDRLQSGDLNLMALVPAADPNAPPAEKAAETPADAGSGWKLGIDYLGLYRGGLRFRDLLVPGSEPMAVSLQSIELRDIALEPEVYGGPADIRFVVKLDEGALRTRARFTPRKDGMAVDVTVEGTKLPVHRSRVYVPGVAWSDLWGFLSVGLRYRLESPGGRNELSGTIGLDDLTVWVAGLDQPALAWKSLGADLGKIDLVKHHAGLKRVSLTGAVVPVRPRGPVVLPVAAAAQAARAAAAGSAPPPSADEPPAAPWSWSVDDVAVHEATARLLADPGLELGITLDTKHLSGPTHEGSPVKLDVAVGDGRLGVDGTLRIEPLGFTGAVTSRSLDVPTLVDAVGALAPGVVQVAKLDADLKVALGSSAPTPGDVTVSGTTSVADLWVTGQDPNEFAAGAKTISVAVQDVTVPGALAKDAAAGRPMTVALDRVAVDALYARVTRTDGGIVLPAFTTPPPTPPPAPPPSSAAPPPQITIASVQVNGRADVMDRTVTPFYSSSFDPIVVDLERLRVPDLEVQKMALHAQSGAKGVIDVKGGYAKKSELEIVVKDLALPSFNPYVIGASPYSISRGSLFVTTKAKIDGQRYDTTTWLTLSDFDLASRSGQHVVLEQLGIPLTVAIALLRDWKGNIDLTVPVKVDEKGAAVDFGTLVAGALVQALVGTLMSPLKIVGAVLPLGGSGAQSLAPAPIRFRPGLSAIDPAGDEQVKQLAAFLAGRPGLGVTLAAPATPADIRALRERALLAKLGPRTGMIGTLRSVGARGRIVDALDARTRGEDAPLEADDAKALEDYLADVPPPNAAAVAQLGQARLELVEGALRGKYGIPANQIARVPPAAEPAEGDPAVRVELGSARR